MSEGESVKVGASLFRLDDTLLTEQLNQPQTHLGGAQAGLDGTNTTLAATQAGVTTAQAQYELALASARLQAQPARSTSWSQTVPSEVDQPAWYFTHTEEITAAQKEIGAASAPLSTAQINFDSLVSTGTYTNLTVTETRT